MFLALAVPWEEYGNVCTPEVRVGWRDGLMVCPWQNSLDNVAVKAGELVDVTGEGDTHNCPS